MKTALIKMLALVLTVLGITLSSPAHGSRLPHVAVRLSPVLVNPDPIDSLPTKVQQEFACVAYAESRDKLVDTNATSGAQGKWQFLLYIWDYARSNIVGLPPTPNQANEWQQDTVAWWFYTRNHGFSPEWSSDLQCLS